MRRAIWSAPPPLPAGTMNSTVLLGSQAKAGATAVSARPTRIAARLCSEVLDFISVSSEVSTGVRCPPSLADIVCWRCGRAPPGLCPASEPLPQDDDESRADHGRDVFEALGVRARPRLDGVVLPGHFARDEADEARADGDDDRIALH